jgi:hypothetical protein
MTPRHQNTITITVRNAVRQTGLSDRYISECIQRSLINEPLTDADLVELRRIRRLQELGVNLPGIEVILHMRQRMRTLQAELDRIARQWEIAGWTAEGDLGPEPVVEQWQRLLPWERS